MNTRIATGLMLASTIALAACQKKAPEELPPPPTATPAPAPAPTGPTVGSQQHFVDAVGQENTVVYFETDRFNIDAEDQAKLQRQAQYFNQYSGVTFTVEAIWEDASSNASLNPSFSPLSETPRKTLLKSHLTTPIPHRGISSGGSS